MYIPDSGSTSYNSKEVEIEGSAPGESLNKWTPSRKGNIPHPYKEKTL